MAIKRSKRLGVVLNVSLKQKEAADRYLADAQLRVTQAEQQLILLQNYMLDYQREFIEAGRKGLSARNMQQHQAFLGRLERALVQQHETIRIAHAQLEKVRHHWNQVYQRFKGIEKLTHNAQTQEALFEEKKLQREIDELGNRFKRPL